MTGWQTAKLWIGQSTGLPDSTLHVLGGMLLLLAAAALIRRPPWHWQPIVALLVLELANETYDMFNPASGEDRLGASFHDLWLTMAVPLALALVVPMLLARSRDAESDSAD